MTPPGPTPEIPYTPPNRLVRDFASRGLVLLSPESLGIPLDVHDRVYRAEKAAYDAKEPVTPSSIPDILDVLAAPGLVDACNRLVGEHWAIVPFTHNASFTSGGRDQHWHKDDNGPYNSRKQRHHQAVQIEMLYYPQTVTPEMGPTAVIPYSQYWTFDHEENQDNFAGADHLDFNYHLSGMERQPVSGPDSNYDPDDIANRRTAHDIRMRDAVTDLGWPLVESFEAAPLRAGSVLLYSHNTFHRGNHRRDDWRTWPDNPRFMWRFWLYRTTDPEPSGERVSVTVDWTDSAVDPLTGIDLSSVGPDLTDIWRYHEHWIRTGEAPPPRDDLVASSDDAREARADRLVEQLNKTGDAAEPERIGAAYRLAAIGDPAIAIRHLSRALITERENVRRAATCGLVTLGPLAAPTFLEAARSPVKWVRKAGVYGLGDAAALTDEVLETVAGRLERDPSVYVRSVAAGSLGCLGRRAIATGNGRTLLPACFAALVAALSREENRLGMNIAQDRSIKFVRPTDECDVCEGNGIDFGLDRFEPVRSAVRENVLWSLVILCTHGPAATGDAFDPTVRALETVIRTDPNLISVGFALDALIRLAQADGDAPSLDDLSTRLHDLLVDPPIRPWESLLRAGLDFRTLSRIAASR